MFEIYNRGTTLVASCDKNEMYQHRTFIGDHVIETNTTNSYWYVDGDSVVSTTGDGQQLHSHTMCVEIFGYTPETRTSTFTRGTDLPYINGCSTKQLIPPVRNGDPTFQYLCIPVFTSEQAHHIHSTARTIYVASGSGRCIIGTSLKHTTYDLREGDVILISKMVPHHFETTEDELVVLPVQIYSAGQQESNHPMFNGTHRV
jgi:mannose-6-phosphate isomerase-like protein (cupin superfamily)